MPTGFSNNKDNKGLEEARQERFKEQQDRMRKMHLATDLNAKKTFLFSTKTTHDMKMAVMKGKEIKIRTLEAEINNLESKEKALEQRAQQDEQVEKRLEAEEAQKKQALTISMQTKRTVESEAQKIDREVQAVVQEEQKVTREIEQKKAQLANFVKEEQALKQKKTTLEAQKGPDSFSKKMEITNVHANAERETREVQRLRGEESHIKVQKEQKKRDLAVTEKEHDDLKREIDVLAKDKLKLEAEVRALEQQSK